MACAITVTFIKDIIMAGAAFTGAVVAVKGLGTWQRQLKGQSEYELSRRILVTLFKYRDAIHGVRYPMMWSNEMPRPPEDEAKKMSRDELTYHGTEKAYQKRWDKVQLERSTLYADILEAEAIWGTDLKNLFKNIFDLEHELLISVRHHIELTNPNTPEPQKHAIIKIDQNKRNILYDDLSADGDEFKKDLFSAIEKIEQYLKPKLTHENSKGWFQ